MTDPKITKFEYPPVEGLQTNSDTTRLLTLFLERYDLITTQDRDLYRSFFRLLLNPPIIIERELTDAEIKAAVDSDPLSSTIDNLLWGDWHRQRGFPETIGGIMLIHTHNSQVEEAFRRGQAYSVEQQQDRYIEGLLAATGVVCDLCKDRYSLPIHVKELNSGCNVPHWRHRGDLHCNAEKIHDLIAKAEGIYEPKN